MCDKLFRGAFVFAAGAVAGAIGAMWLMSDKGEKTREELRDLASKAKDTVQECCEQLKQEMEEDHGTGDK